MTLAGTPTPTRVSRRLSSGGRCGSLALLLGALLALALFLRRETTALRLPAIGVGTKSGSTLEDIAAAISAGFTLIDTKDTNLSLEALGAAIHASKLPRDAFFIVSKLVGERNPAAHAPAGVEAATRAALAAPTSRWDCYMIHVTHLAGLRAGHLPRAGESRRRRPQTVGLSNVRTEQLEFLLREARIPPAVVEQEVHPYNQSALGALPPRGVALLAHSPLGSALRARLAEPTLVEIAAARRLVAAVCCGGVSGASSRSIEPRPRALVQQISPPPRAADVDDMAAVARLDRRERGWRRTWWMRRVRHDVILARIGERSAFVQSDCLFFCVQLLAQARRGRPHVAEDDKRATIPVRGRGDRADSVPRVLFTADGGTEHSALMLGQLPRWLKIRM